MAALSSRNSIAPEWSASNRYRPFRPQELFSTPACTAHVFSELPCQISRPGGQIYLKTCHDECVSPPLLKQVTSDRYGFSLQIPELPIVHYPN